MRLGEPLLEVETDKGVNELESVADGVVLRRLVRDGAKVGAGELIAWVGQPAKPSPTRPPGKQLPPRRRPARLPRALPLRRRLLCPPGRGSPLPAPAGERYGVDLADDPGNRPRRCATRADMLRSKGGAPRAAPARAAAGATRSRLTGNQAAVARKVAKSRARNPGLPREHGWRTWAPSLAHRGPRAGRRAAPWRGTRSSSRRGGYRRCSRSYVDGCSEEVR